MTRLEVLKTYKIYIGGQFPRTESGRYYSFEDSTGQHKANICLSSRKDFKNAVVAARSAFNNWANKTAFNRSQILYRIAEVMESRKSQFISELMLQGSTKKIAENEVNISIDRLVYFAGWCDKFQAIFSSVNPVSSSHFNFSNPEPMGVVSIIAPEETSLIGLISVMAPVIAGGNTCIILASEKKPLCAISLAEVLNSSDLPSGVVNILTGESNELHIHFASHMDVNAILYCRDNSKEIVAVKEKSAINLKRGYIWNKQNWTDEKHENPYIILDTLEIKTTWHPIEKTGSSHSGY